jgi:arabinofuranosyltransferase
MNAPIAEIIAAYGEHLARTWPTKAALAALGAGVAVVLVRRVRCGREESRAARTLARAAVAAAAAYGLWRTWEARSLVDDAFISFRYARNLAEGHGLVWNVGERVEGYTNFLWTLLLAALVRLTGAEAPGIALVLGPLCYVADIAVVYKLGRALSRDARVYLPLAAILLAVNYLATEYATTGMETTAANLLVHLGLYFLVTREDTRGAGLAGLFLILATLTRPDHALFYVLGGGVLLARAVATRTARPLFAFAAPFAGYLGYLAWKLAYYGAVLPNTFHAKSAASAYAAQGVVYAATFYLGVHGWALALLFGLGLARPARTEAMQRFRLFAGGAFVLWNAYVPWVGGDFMFGRFLLPLLPLLLLGAESLVLSAASTGRSATAVAAALGLLLATARGASPIPPGTIRWGIADEGTVYAVTSLRPIEVHHPNFRAGKFFGRVLTDRGIAPVIATSGIGMVGYYSRLPVIDLLGLTDATVARRTLAARGRPGHEKRADDDYLARRAVRIVRRAPRPERFADVARLRLPDVGGKPWYLFRYDRDLMREVRARAPEIGFVDFETYLDDRLAGEDAVRRDAAWFRSYYFDATDDPERLRALEALGR